MNCGIRVISSVILFLALEVIFLDAYKITSFLPESGSASVKEGGSLDLWCNADYYWEWCKFTSESSGRFCELQWESAPDNVTINNCDDFLERFEYLGDYDNYKCGIRIHDVRPDEAGEWTCLLDDYDGRGYRHGTQVEHSFNVDVELKPKPTTTTTTTTPKTNTKSADKFTSDIWAENADKFKITSYIPESGSTAIKEGGSLDLWCNVNNWWELCAFKHVPSNRVCSLKWEHAPYNVTVDDCTDFEGRFEYLGDYDNYKCGIRLHDVRPADKGEWACELENYYYADTEPGYGYEVRKSFQVDVTTNDSS